MAVLCNQFYVIQYEAKRHPKKTCLSHKISLIYLPLDAIQISYQSSSYLMTELSHY